MFLVALSLSYICKILGGINMKSSITQIERRFDIPSSTAGVIDGGFEMGNLLVIVFVSYFGSKLHRPKLIGIGCIVMGAGSILTALPHFFMGYYRYSTENLINPSENSIATCSINQTSLLAETSPRTVGTDCEKEPESYMWIYVLLGNMLRGIGETPIAPLGISYIDDFAKDGQSSVYIGTLNAIAMIGVIGGFLIGSVTMKLYVDVGFVDLSTIRITPQDSRWVGAWWLGFLIAGLLSIICSIPFFFLPQNPNKPQKERKVSTSLHGLKTNEDTNHTANLTNRRHSITVNVVGFSKSMKSLLTNHLYVLYVFLTLMQMSTFIGSFTYLFKYIEQQYGQTVAQANFMLGLITIPFMATGMILGGYLIKKLKLTVIGIAKYYFFISCMLLIFHLCYFALICERKSIAGLTLTYDGTNPVTSHTDMPLPYCNSDCSCDEHQWEPVCGDNGITYLSPCLAGCRSTQNNTQPTVFHNCSCLGASSFQSTNYSAHLGECPRDKSCKNKHYLYIFVQILDSAFSAMAGTAFLLLIVRNVLPELKSLAMGFYFLVIRMLGGILAPIYYGALVDRTCLKWSTTSCGARGACRVYDSILFGNFFLGLSAILKIVSLLACIVLIYAMKKKYEGKDTKAMENEEKMNNDVKLESLAKNIENQRLLLPFKAQSPTVIEKSLEPEPMTSSPWSRFIKTNLGSLDTAVPFSSARCTSLRA
ncbi:solute carrier organic anion transporter family member 1B3-like [Ctenodactylus gundi]